MASSVTIKFCWHLNWILQSSWRWKWCVKHKHQSIFSCMWHKFSLSSFLCSVQSKNTILTGVWRPFLLLSCIHMCVPWLSPVICLLSSSGYCCCWCGLISGSTGGRKMTFILYIFSQQPQAYTCTPPTHAFTYGWTFEVKWTLTYLA